MNEVAITPTPESSNTAKILEVIQTVAEKVDSWHIALFVVLSFIIVWTVCRKIQAFKVLPFRANILLIAGCIFALGLAISALIFKAIMSDGGSANDNQFVIGALIGLLGSAITGLAGLGTTLVSDKPEKADEAPNKDTGRVDDN